jgi:O-methyltransferase
MSLKRKVFQFLSGVLKNKNTYLITSLNYKKVPSLLEANFDHVRYTCLSLCYEEIISRKVEGNVAELGVYKGDFAKRLNKLFTDRKIYLFDTFEGFNENDISIEKVNGFSTGSQNFSETSVELVLNKMKYPQNCIVKKGYFPATTEGVDDKFCFISLDADLYEPILQGLRFFYPKLNNGGYIFVHDYNNDEYTGAKQAVIEFCTEQNINYTPIPDSGGSVIISK